MCASSQLSSLYAVLIYGPHNSPCTLLIVLTKLGAGNIFSYFLEKYQVTKFLLFYSPPKNGHSQHFEHLR